MFDQGRPRYWIDWYDRWHLLLPVFLAALLVLLWMQPQPPGMERNIFDAERSAGVTGLGVSTAGGRGTPGTGRSLGTAGIGTTPALPPMQPTTLETPQNGKGFFQSRLSDAEGRAEPGSTLYLDYANQDLVWHNLGTMTVEWDGHYRFQLKNFPPGHYRLRARAVTANGRTSETGEIMITVTPDPARPSRRRAPRR